MSYVLIANNDDFIDMAQYVKNEEILYLDTETTSLDPYTAQLLLMSLRAANTTFVVDFTRVNPLMLEYIRDTLEYKKIVIHNATFDWKFIYHNSGINMQNMHCSLVAEQVLLAGLNGYGNGLDDVALRRLGKQLNKSTREYFINYSGFLPEIAFEYAGEDVDVLEPIYKQQMEEFKQKDLMRVYEIEMPLLPVTASMEYKGIAFDKEKMERARPVFKTAVLKADRDIQNTAIQLGSANRIIFTKHGYRVVNPSSNVQMLELLHSMGVDVPSTNKNDLAQWDTAWSTGKSTQTAGAIDEYDDDDFSINYAHPFLRKFAIYKAMRKLDSDYGEGLYSQINPITKRIHSSLKQCGGAATGRFSSTSPNLQNTIRFDNMQALGMAEHNIRTMFIAPPGRKLAIADLSGIEMAILGALSRDENLLKQMNGDIHTYVASHLFGREVVKGRSDVDTLLRTIAKTITYSIMYGASGWKLYRQFVIQLGSVGIHITKEDADEWIVTWKSLFPKAGKVLDTSAKNAITRGFVTTVTGRRRNWDIRQLNTTGRINAAMREASNSPIQGSSADILKVSMKILSDRMDHARSDLLLCVHDELIAEADNEYADDLLELMLGCFMDAGKILFPDFPRGYIHGEGHVSNCYDK